MASSKEYLEFVLEQLAELDEITYRAMMGEYIIYYHGKIVGGIYDDRLLVKPIKSAISYMPMKTMVDRFGEDVTTLAYDMTSFRVQTEVSASPTFFGWVFGFNGKVQILAPESVKEQYRQMIAQADEGMQQKENKEQEI